MLVFSSDEQEERHTDGISIGLSHRSSNQAEGIPGDEKKSRVFFFFFFFVRHSLQAPVSQMLVEICLGDCQGHVDCGEKMAVERSETNTSCFLGAAATKKKCPAHRRCASVRNAPCSVLSHLGVSA